MIIKVYRCGKAAFDTIDDRLVLSEEYFTRNFCVLPRGYKEEYDNDGRRYILCPNGTKVYELEQHKRDTKACSFVYNVDGHIRRVRMPIVRHKQETYCSKCGKLLPTTHVGACPCCGSYERTIKTLSCWEKVY